MDDKTPDEAQSEAAKKALAKWLQEKPVGEALRALYAHVLDEETPQQLKTLIDRIREQELRVRGSND